MACTVNVFFAFEAASAYDYAAFSPPVLFAKVSPMTEHIASLADLRHEIDVLDDQIQDLLRRRAEAVEKVAVTKRATGGDNRFFLRCGREAQILRRLLARQHGPLPGPALVRINRELIGALYDLQAAVRVAVLAPNKSVARWDIARDHYGSTVPMLLCATATSAMREISAQAATIGVMPMPEDGEKDPWWPMLANNGAETPRVLAKLPFVPNPRGRLADLNALVIGRCPPEASGDDRSLVVLQMSGAGVSLARVGSLLAQAGIAGQVLAQHTSGGQDARLLLDIADFHDETSAPLVALRAAAPDMVQDITVIGAYAVPMAE